MLDVLPLIAIPAVILAHWRTASLRFRETGAPQRFGSAERARMTDLERVVTLVGTLALIANLIGVTDRGDKPNGLVAGAAIIFAAYLFMDFYIGLRHPDERRRP